MSALCTFISILASSASPDLSNFSFLLPFTSCIWLPLMMMTEMICCYFFISYYSSHFKRVETLLLSPSLILLLLLHTYTSSVLLCQLHERRGSKTFPTMNSQVAIMWRIAYCDRCFEIHVCLIHVFACDDDHDHHLVISFRENSCNNRFPILCRFTCLPSSTKQ